MSAVIQAKKSKKPVQNKSEASFNRLRKKIEGLERKVKSTYGTLDECLSFYHNEIKPKEAVLAGVFVEIVKIFYDYYKNEKQQPKKQKEVLKNIIIEKIHSAFSMEPFNRKDAELLAIIKELEGHDFNEIMANEMNHFKEELQEKFKEEGIDIDLSFMKADVDQGEMFRKFAEAMFEARDNLEENFKKKPKSKKQIELELKAKKLEDLQKQGVSSIYKQLAKVFHPDLEQDPIQKVEKEKLMKQLTVAYDNNDLHQLLKLELEWMNSSQEKGCTKSEEQLEIYNSVLKEQVKALQMEIDMAPSHPKYFSIHEYINVDADMTIFVLNMANNDLHNEILGYHEELKKLKSNNKAKVIKDIISL